MCCFVQASEVVSLANLGVALTWPPVSSIATVHLLSMVSEGRATVAFGAQYVASQISLSRNPFQACTSNQKRCFTPLEAERCPRLIQKVCYTARKLQWEKPHHWRCIVGDGSDVPLFTKGSLVHLHTWNLRPPCFSNGTRGIAGPFLQCHRTLGTAPKSGLTG